MAGVFALTWATATKPAGATTWHSIDLKCPCCAKTTKGAVITSTNTFGGTDSDLFAHARGEDRVNLLAVTCSHCYYSGYQSDFEGAKPLTGEQKEALKKRLKPIMPIAAGTPSYRMPAAVRYDLVAQTYRLLGRSNEEIADAYLWASWGERLDFDASRCFNADFMRRFRQGTKKLALPKTTADMGSPYLNKYLGRGRLWREMAAGLEREVRAFALLLALKRFRYHGWNGEVREILEELEPLLEAETYARFKQSVVESLTREQVFQSEAAGRFAECVKRLEKGKKRAVLSYLTGELNRRAGHALQAKLFFERAAEATEPAWVAKAARAQAGLMAKPDNEKAPEKK
jgi:hypothetical protein